MANGLIGSLVLPDTTVQLVATVTQNCFWSEIEINVLNPTASDITAKIAISANGLSTPNPDDYVEQGGVVAALGGSINHSNKMVNAGSKIFVQGSALGLVVQVRGKAITKR